MLNCRLIVDVGSDFDSLNFALFRLPLSADIQIPSNPVFKQELQCQVTIHWRALNCDVNRFFFFFLIWAVLTVE